MIGRHLRAIGRSFASAYASNLQYRVEFLLYMSAGLIPIFMLFAWRSLADAGYTGDVDRTWFAAYFLFVFASRQLSPIWLIREMDRQVRLGQLSHHLLRPAPLYWRLIGHQLSDNAIRLPVILIIVPLGLFLFDAWPAVQGARLPLFLLSLLLAVLIHFHLELSIGLTAFWTDQSWAFEDFYTVAFYLLTGFTVPLTMFPETMQHVLSWLPWRYMFGLPVEFLMGEHAGAQLVGLIAGQILWLGLTAGTALLLWRRGLRRFTGAGA
ncbi:ABC transporter permease [Dongia sp.]|uniref:ABC transporter permease n=1 Tax=Dongia sp. TaxID=1977262 RepID=UPI0035B177C6